MNEVGKDIQAQAMDSWQIVRNRLGLICLSFILVFVTAAIITYIMPRKYRGRVDMKIERLPTKVEVFSRSGAEFMAPSDVMIKNEYETIKKPETLYIVVVKLDLQRRWSLPTRQAALAKLVNNLDTQYTVRSDFVVIEYFDQDAVLAAEIANVVASSYMQQRTEIDSKQKLEELERIGKQIAEQEQLRDQARLKMQEAKKKAGIVGDWVLGGGPSITPGATIQTSQDSMSISREQALLQADLEVQNLNAEIEQLAKLSPDELVARASGLRLENPNLTGMTVEYQKLQISREGLVQQGLGKRHPLVQGADSQLAKSKELILSETQSHIQGLQNRYEAAKKRRDALKNYSDVADKEQLDKGDTYNEYKIAKDEVTYIEALLVRFKEAYSETKAGLELVKTPATIYAKAEVETRPAKPNVMINLALGAILGLMFGLGLAFFLEYMDMQLSHRLRSSSLQRSIEQTYINQEIYTRPSVLVSIDGGESAATMRTVMVSGANKPGAVPYRQGMTISQAIMTAGGPTPFGSMKKVKLIRAGRPATIHNLSSNAGDPSVDIQVQPDDQIIVPE